MPLHHHLSLAAWGAWSALALCAGCSQPQADDPLLQDVEPPKQFIEYDLGKYVIPIPATLNEEIGPARRNVMQIEFVMHAVVPPQLEPQVAQAWTKHEGKFRDRVIELCRTTSLDDLQEPGLGTLKSHLLDAVRPIFGRATIDRLVLTEVQYQTLE